MKLLLDVAKSYFLFLGSRGYLILLMILLFVGIDFGIFLYLTPMVHPALQIIPTLFAYIIKAGLTALLILLVYNFFAFRKRTFGEIIKKSWFKILCLALLFDLTSYYLPYVRAILPSPALNALVTLAVILIMLYTAFTWHFVVIEGFFLEAIYFSFQHTKKHLGKLFLGLIFSILISLPLILVIKSFAANVPFIIHNLKFCSLNIIKVMGLFCYTVFFVKITKAEEAPDD